MRIDVAYCIELNEVIDIQIACFEYAKLYEAAKASNAPVPRKFNFLCSDPICRLSRKDGVRIIGVNYHKSPEEQEASKSAHYRIHDDHIDSCEWVELDEALKEDDQNENALSITKRRKLLRKVSRLITRFVMPELGGGAGNTDVVDELERIKMEPDPALRRKKRLAYAHGIGSTATSLEALVSCYEELKAEDALYEELSVPGTNSTTFKEVFRQFTYGAPSHFSVLHGGARLYKRYGKGFSLSFIDKYNSLPVSLYVSAEHLSEYRPGARLKRIVDELEINADKRPYIRVYWIGELEREEKFYRAQFKNLSHVVFRIVYPN
jgi:hypothetical protein